MFQSRKKKSIAPGGCVKDPKRTLENQMKNSVRGRPEFPFAGEETEHICFHCGINPVKREGDVCIPCEEAHDCR